MRSPGAGRFRSAMTDQRRQEEEEYDKDFEDLVDELEWRSPTSGYKINLSYVNKLVDSINDAAKADEPDIYYDEAFNVQSMHEQLSDTSGEMPKDIDTSNASERFVRLNVEVRCGSRNI